MSDPRYSNQRPTPARSARPTTGPARPVYRYTRQFLEQEDGEVRRATWGPRVVAGLFDFALVGVPFNLLGNLLWLPKAEVAGEGIDSTATGFNGLPLEWHYLLWIAAFTIYATFTTLALGATPGKRLMNLKVVGPGERSLALPRLLWRYSLPYPFNLAILAYLLGRLTLGISFGTLLAALVLLADFALLVADQRGQTLHDKLSGSQVVLADLTKL